MGAIYAFTSKTKPWVKLGMTTNCPIGRIEDYNASHGTDFDVETLRDWFVPDCVCLQVEQEIHKELERNDFDRVRKGSANEIFTYAGRSHSDFIRLITAKILALLMDVNHQFNTAIRRTSEIQMELSRRGNRGDERAGMGAEDQSNAPDGKIFDESYGPEIPSGDYETPTVMSIDSRGWGVFHCVQCGNKLAAPRRKRLMITCPKCDVIYPVQLA